MLYLILYFLIAFAISVSLANLLFRAGGRRRRWSLKYLAVCVLCLPVAPYLIVEVQTALLWPHIRGPLNGALKQNGEGTNYCYVKVIRYYGSRVSVLVVVPSRAKSRGAISTTGLVYELESSSGGWMYRDDWECAWSDQGSAKGNVFPPYPDACP